MNEQLETRCCIAGGGPAGMMLGYLLARAGVDVMVLEKHGDFLRDFRGDTVHPSTLEVLHELGLLKEFLKRPHSELAEAAVEIAGERIPIVDLSHVPAICKFIAFMPQWDFLNFIAENAKQYRGFHLLMNAEVTSLIEDHGQIRGVSARTQTGDAEIRAVLTVAADGRSSIVREKSGLEVQDLGAPMDVLWFRLSRQQDDPTGVLGRVGAGKFMVSLDRGDYWQCGFVIPKGGIERVRARGLPSLGDEIVDVAPFLKNRVDELKNWDDVKLLTVKVDRLCEWHRPGLLCIGDAAHAMSPIGGVGINLAIQDAVAAANTLAEPLLSDHVTERVLQSVQERRMFPTVATQRMQTVLQNRIVEPALQSKTEIRKVPLLLRLFRGFPLLRRIPARLLGIGFRPEHVRPELRARG